MNRPTLQDRMLNRLRVAGLIEGLLCAAVLASLVHVIWWVLIRGYLPQPFIWVVFDTFMDWHNTAFWAHNPGTYDVWQSVYPPISFVFLRIFSDGACYDVSASIARDCDIIGRSSLIGFWLLGSVLSYLVFRRIDPKTAVLRGLALGLGLPMLYGLERGNLVIPCYVAFVLGHGHLFRSARLRWLAHAVAINFKPYLVLTLLPLAAKRRWRWFEGAGIATLAIYLLTFALQGGGNPFEIAANTRVLAELQGGGNWSDIFYATSFTSIVRFITSDFPVAYYTGSKLLETLALSLTLVMRCAQAAVVGCFILAWLHPRSIRTRHLTGAVTAMILTTSQPSGYAQIFLLFFVFMEPWRGPVRIGMLISAYLVCVSFDHQIFDIEQPLFDAWLTGRQVQPQIGVAIGQFVRPTLLLVIQFGYVALMVTSVAREVAWARGRDARRASTARSGATRALA